MKKTPCRLIHVGFFWYLCHFTYIHTHMSRFFSLLVSTHPSPFVFLYLHMERTVVTNQWLAHIQTNQVQSFNFHIHQWKFNLVFFFFLCLISKLDLTPSPSPLLISHSDITNQKSKFELCLTSWSRWSLLTRMSSILTRWSMHQIICQS